METNAFAAKASIQVLKNVNEVFEAIADPAKLTNYWINKSSGRIEEGAELLWGFPEMEERFTVKAGKVITNKLITFYWDAEGGGKHEVEIILKPYRDSTIVYVAEKPIGANNPGTGWLTGNTEGWANFLACLKAWAEYGINLRKGAFDYRFETEA